MIQQVRPRSVAGKEQDMGLFSSQTAGLSPMQSQNQSQDQSIQENGRPAETIYNSGFTENRDPYGSGVDYETQVEKGGGRWQDVSEKKSDVDASNYRGGDAVFDQNRFNAEMGSWYQGHVNAFMGQNAPLLAGGAGGNNGPGNPFTTAMRALSGSGGGSSANPLATAFLLWQAGQVIEGDRPRAETEARRAATTYTPVQERQTETISTLRGRAPYSYANASEAAAGPSSEFIARRESTWNPGAEVADEAQFSNLSQAERDAISRMRGR